MNAVAPDPRRWKALILICTAIFVVVLDIAIVNVALPTIQEDLNFAERNLQWVITAYGLTYGGFLLLGGRAADLIGRRIVFMTGLAIFGAASLVCGLSTSSGMLIAARGVQGFGAAIVTPAALSIISVTFTEGAERNKALGAWGAVGGSGAAAGVLMGGVLTKYLGWEWIFWVNVPGRRDRPDPHADLRAREPARGRRPRIRPARCDQRDLGPDRARLRDLGGAAGRLGDVPDDRPARASRACCSRSSCGGRRARRNR